MIWFVHAAVGWGDVLVVYRIPNAFNMIWAMRSGPRALNVLVLLIADLTALAHLFLIVFGVRLLRLGWLSLVEVEKQLGLYCFRYIFGLPPSSAATQVVW